MKKLTATFLIFSLLGGIMYGQHLIRVNNNPAAGADYTTLQAAHNAASNGDTIYVEGSATIYSAGATITKRLTILGPGYFLNENDTTQASTATAFFTGAIVFDPGSSGSVIMGITSIGAYANIYSSTNNILITRCRASGIYCAGSNNLILQNYADAIGSNGNAALINSVIANNIAGSLNFNGSSTSNQIYNNILTATNFALNAYSSNIYNNILTNSAGYIVVNTGNTIKNNLHAKTGSNDSDGNKYGITMSDVFIDFGGTLGYSTDARWQLKPGSLAMGAGFGGTDCGAFAGTSPYMLSGLPALPHIYEASLPATAYSDTGLDCTIKVKSGN